jgi:hypothetical protein
MSELSQKKSFYSGTVFLKVQNLFSVFLSHSLNSTKRNPRSKHICVDEEGGCLNAGHRMTSPTIGLAKIAGWASATGEKRESALPLLTPEDLRVLSSKMPW